MPIEVHLIDGTYELFRHFYAVPSRRTESGQEVAAVRGVLGNVLGLLEAGATHLAVATDHIIPSFRNDLWAAYKDGSEVDPEIAQQFEPLERGLQALGIEVWPMVEFEADDALAAGAALASRDDRVEKVPISTPDTEPHSPNSGSSAHRWSSRMESVFKLPTRSSRSTRRPARACGAAWSARERAPKKWARAPIPLPASP